MAAEDLDAIIGRLNHMALSQEEPDVQRERYLRSFRSFYARHAWRRLAPVSCVLAISDVHADAVCGRLTASSPPLKCMAQVQLSRSIRESVCERSAEECTSVH